VNWPLSGSASGALPTIEHEDAEGSAFAARSAPPDTNMTHPEPRKGLTMPSQTLSNKVITQMPPVIAEHIDAVNAFDTDRILNTFAVDAYVNDNNREIWGADAIRKFMDQEIIGYHVTMQVREIIDNYGQIIVRAQWDGTYDKTNLPDELIVTSYFSIQDGKIVGLAIIANQPSPY
jgi:hypothetical protein